MRTLTTKIAIEILSSHRIKLGSVTNQENQTVNFFLAEEFSGMVYCDINNIFANTGFTDIADMLENHGEYTPILNEENQIVCGFEYYPYGECKELLSELV